MSADLLDKLTDSLADQVIAKLGPKLVEYLNSQRVERTNDPLLTVQEVSAQLHVSRETVRQLVEVGHINRVPGIRQIRVRQSAVDAYGTLNQPTKRK